MLNIASCIIIKIKSDNAFLVGLQRHVYVCVHVYVCKYRVSLELFINNSKMASKMHLHIPIHRVYKSLVDIMIKIIMTPHEMTSIFES